MTQHHTMHLHAEPFNLIQTGQKRIESRLNDEKRQEISIGDTITFTCRSTHQTCLVKVIGLLQYASFNDLQSDFPLSYFGRDLKFYQENPSEFYSAENIATYGVLGIRIELEQDN